MEIKAWTPPAAWPQITTNDAHAAGEPFRVVTGGAPELPGDTILARCRYMREHFDHLRTALMFEPRGHADMYGCIVTPPVSLDADFGVLFTHNEGYSSMCGHGIVRHRSGRPPETGIRAALTRVPRKRTACRAAAHPTGFRRSSRGSALHDRRAGSGRGRPAVIPGGLSGCRGQQP
jgi:hypothetical protein